MCFGHTMNLSVKKGLGVEGIGSTLNRCRCRKVIGHFNHSNLAKEALKNKQRQLNMSEKSLKQDVDTRWNSTYDMVGSVIENDEAISSVLRTNSKYGHLLLSPDEVTTLRSIYDVLEPWKKLTVLLSAEAYPTISLVAPSLHKLLTTALRHLDTDPELIKRMKTAMFEDLNSRYQDTDLRMMLNIAAFLDPRFRQLEFVSDAEDKKKIKNEVKRRMISLDTKFSAVKTEPEDNEEQPAMPELPIASSSGQEVESKAKKPKIEDNFFQDFFSDVVITSVKPAATPMEKAKQEMKLYLSLPIDTVMQQGGQLAWWKEHQGQIPMMAKLAKYILCIPATSTPSERMFSKAGNLINKKRASLKPHKVDMMLFLNANYKL